MQQRISERESAKLFWNTHKKDYMETRSIKEVFEAYKHYTNEKQLPILNEYIFRTFIRKNGYCNSVAENDLEKVKMKKEEKRKKRIERKKVKKDTLALK